MEKDPTVDNSPDKGRRNISGRGWIVAFLVSFSLVLGPAAFGAAYGPKGYYTVSGYHYYNQADIQMKLAPVNDWAGVEVGINGSGTAPAGYMGALARGYSEGGALKCSSGYKYTTSSAAVSFWFACYFNGTGSSNYYSHGVTKGYNVSTGTYKAYFTKKSPLQTN